MASSLTVANNVLHYTCDSITGGLTDTSGNSNTGTIAGSGTTLVAGQIGQAVSFNGSGYVSFSSISQFVLASQTSTFSVCCWVRTTATDATLLSLRDSTGVTYLGFVVGSNAIDNAFTGKPSVGIRGDNNAGLTTVNATTAVNDGNWHHVAFTRNSSQLITIYIDGVSNTSATDGLTSGITPNTAYSAIANDMLGSLPHLSGSLDDFQIYNRALTSTEVNSIYTAGISGAQIYQISATPAGSGNIQSKLIGRMAARSTWPGIGSIPLNTQVTLAAVAHTYSISAPLTGAGLLASRLISSPRISALLAGAGSKSFSLGAGRYLNIGNVFSGGLIDPDTGLPYGTWHGRGRIGATFGRMMGIFAQFSGEGNCEDVTAVWMQADFIWPGIVEDAGEQVLYRQAAGLEKSLATVDAYRLTQTYAELIRDQWDPYRISSANLPYLAWAMGVNLWEDTWSEDFKRWWVANQWTMKYERGSAKGLNDFVDTVNASPGMHAKIVNLVVPPACFYPGKALTDTERAAYVARFPQLRLYPYAPRPQLPYLGYLGGFSLTRSGQKIFVKNGRFLGPLRKYYPTNYNAGGDYLRSATLYEPRTGVEIQLTVRTVVAAPQPGQKEITYDEISLSSIAGNLFYPGKNNKKYLLSKHPIAQKLKHAVVLGRLPYTPSRLVRIPRDGTLDRTQFQALFTTVGTGLDPINVRPEHVYQQHPTRQLEWYCGMPLRRTYLTKSNAWMFLYERWYLFDPTRLPDDRKASTYMGRARFGIHKYTAEADIQAWFTWPKFYARANGYYGKGRFFPPKNTKLIDQIRRAVTASMAVRDTVQIDTNIKRTIQIRDLTVLDGRFSIGQYITDRTA